jgi:hypothetical protein
MLKSFISLVLLTAAFPLMGTVAFAQSTEPPPPLEAGGGMVWGALGFQGDLGGAVNSSGIGVVNGLRAEINTNTWAERYDAALIFRFGGAVNISETSQVFGTFTWDQSEADLGPVGLVGGQTLQAKFSDYQGWGIDGGYRYFPDLGSAVKPFFSASIGFQRLEAITVDFASARFNATAVPFYDDSWVAVWQIGTGFLIDFNPHVGLQVTADIKHAGVLSDQAGLGTLGFERVNDVGNRWTLPVLTGIYVKF